jgi:hypothetical protein
MKNKKLLVCGICLLLVGCATAAQREARHNDEVTVRASAQLKVCKAAIFKEPENHILFKHMVHGAQPTLAQLTDKAKATEEEIEAADRVQSETQECRESYLESIGSVTPSLVPMFVGEMEALDSIMLDLVERKITWGEYNKRVQVAIVDSREEVKEGYEQINAQLELSHEAELAQRQAAIDAISQLLVYYENARHAKAHRVEHHADYKKHERE